MGAIKLKNKHPVILDVFNEISGIFGSDYFDKYFEDEDYFVIDFWEGDLYALGLKKADRVAYISAWDFRDLDVGEMKYYVELEIIDSESLAVIRKIKEATSLAKDEVINLLITFWGINDQL